MIEGIFTYELARDAYFYLITSTLAAGEALVFTVYAIRGMECIGHITSYKYGKEYCLNEVHSVPLPSAHARTHTCIQYPYKLF